MENASKALIIAGAILLAILLISVGIMVFNMVTDPMEEAQGQVAGQGAQMFNSSFEAYGARPQTASQIRALINIVNTNNSQNDRQVGITAERIYCRF